MQDSLLFNNLNFIKSETGHLTGRVHIRKLCRPQVITLYTQLWFGHQ